MTDSDEAYGADGQSAQERLRMEILTSALYDWVPLIEVKSLIGRYGLAETVTARQDLALITIRSLLEDGLMQIGELPYPGEKFPAWDLPIDVIMERLYDCFVRQHADPDLWHFRYWLGLTEAGKRLAQELESSAED
jgi:hypothetical protein